MIKVRINFRVPGGEQEAYTPRQPDDPQTFAGVIGSYNRFRVPISGPGAANTLLTVSGITSNPPEGMADYAGLFGLDPGDSVEYRIITDLQLDPGTDLVVVDGALVHTSSVYPIQWQADDEETFSTGIETVSLNAETELRLLTLTAVGPAYGDSTLLNLAFQSVIPLIVAPPP